MKNQSENLNFALPISETSKASGNEALFFIRNLRVQDGNLMHTKNWKEIAKLPSSIDVLREKAIPSKNEFYKKLIEEFRKKFQDELFPRHPKFRSYLRNQSLTRFSGEINKDPNLNVWNIKAPKFTKVKVSKDLIIYTAAGDVFPHHVLIEKEKGQSLKNSFFNDLRNIKAIAKGLSISRKLAGETIPILSYDRPTRVFSWKDQLGRNFRTLYWYIHYNNTFLTVHTTPVP